MPTFLFSFLSWYTSIDVYIFTCPLFSHGFTKCLNEGTKKGGLPQTRSFLSHSIYLSPSLSTPLSIPISISISISNPHYRASVSLSPLPPLSVISLITHHGLEKYVLTCPARSSWHFIILLFTYLDPQWMCLLICRFHERLLTPCIWRSPILICADLLSGLSL